MPDLYDSLGVRRDADRETIKRAYRKRAQKAHPDRGGDAEKFHVIRRAYEVLSDDARRSRYDATGDEGAGAAIDETSQLLNALAQMVLAAIDSADPDTTNILDVVHGQLKQGRLNVEQARKNAGAKIKRRERALKRLQKKGGGENLIAQMIEGDIAACRRAIEMANAEGARLDRMIELVGEYVYQGAFQSGPVVRGMAIPVSMFQTWSR